LASATADVEVTSHLEHSVRADQSEKPGSLGCVFKNSAVAMGRSGGGK